MNKGLPKVDVNVIEDILKSSLIERLDEINDHDIII